MPLPDLFIASCEAGELAPDEPLCAPAQYRVRVWRNWRFQTYLVREVKMIWKQTHNQRVFAAQNTKPNSPTLFAEFVPGENMQRTFQHTLGRRFSHARWMRFLYFENALAVSTSRSNWQFCLEFAGPWRKLWRRDYAGSLVLLQMERPTWRPSYWHTFSCRDLSLFISQLLRNPNSDCSFSLKLLQMSTQEHRALFFPILRGTTKECEHLLRLILQIDPLLNASQAWELDMPLATKDCLDYWSPYHAKLCPVNHRGNISMVGQDLTRRQMYLLNLVVRHFGLHWNNLHSRYKASYLDWYGHFHYRVHPLETQHERLEACLELRDWLRDKVSPEELAELMG